MTTVGKRQLGRKMPTIERVRALVSWDPKFGPYEYLDRDDVLKLLALYEETKDCRRVQKESQRTTEVMIHEEAVDNALADLEADDGK